MEEVQENRGSGWLSFLPIYISIAYLILSLCVAAYSIYWMIICGVKIWLSAIGGGIVAVNFFILLFALAAAVAKILNVLKVLESVRAILKSVEVVATVLALVFCCVSISLSTYAMADRYYQELVDYCQRNANSTTVANFAATYSTYHSQSEFIHKRSTDAGAGMEALFGCWVSCFVLEFVLKLAGIAKDDDAPLLPRRKPRKEKPKKQSQAEEPLQPQSDGYEYQYEYSDHD